MVGKRLLVRKVDIVVAGNRVPGALLAALLVIQGVKWYIFPAN